MKPHAIRRTLILGAILALTLPLARLFSQNAAKDTQQMNQGVSLPDKIQWQEGPPSLPSGAKMATLEGDMTKAGPFTVRFRFPAGYHIPAHTHPGIEHLTILSGSLKLAMGDHLERAAAHTLPTGAFAVMPANMKHEAWVEGETIIQGHGIGPWAINYLNAADDPRNAKK